MSAAALLAAALDDLLLVDIIGVGGLELLVAGLVDVLTSATLEFEGELVDDLAELGDGVVIQDVGLAQPVEEQVVSIWAGTNGKLDTIEVEDVLRFERDLLDHVRRHTTILDRLRDTNVLDDDTVAELGKVVDDFVVQFQGGGGQHIDEPGREEFKAADAEDVNQEQIVKGRRK